MRFNQHSSLYLVLRALNYIRYPNQAGRRVDLGLRASLRYFFSRRYKFSFVRRILVVVVSGRQSSRSRYILNRLRSQFTRLGVQVYVVGVGRINFRYLRPITYMNRHVYSVRSFASLVTRAGQIARAIHDDMVRLILNLLIFKQRRTNWQNCGPIVTLSTWLMETDVLEDCLTDGLTALLADDIDYRLRPCDNIPIWLLFENFDFDWLGKTGVARQKSRGTSQKNYKHMKNMLLTSFGDSEGFLYNCWAGLITVTNEIQFTINMKFLNCIWQNFSYLLSLHLHVILVWKSKKTFPYQFFLPVFSIPIHNFVHQVFFLCKTGVPVLTSQSYHPQSPVLSGIVPNRKQNFKYLYIWNPKKNW